MKVPASSWLSLYAKTYDASAWAKEKGMRTFLSVAQGTHEPAKFLEMYVLFLFAPHVHLSFTLSGFPYHGPKPPSESHYKGSKEPNARPLAFVGKGITFDSGGTSLKPGPVRPPFTSFLRC